MAVLVVAGVKMLIELQTDQSITVHKVKKILH